ncbi:MAG: arabinofuranosidase catalytic domain-containing protein [Candidatus Pacearchaeota archaeon]|jgi:hypothetical protein
MLGLGLGLNKNNYSGAFTGPLDYYSQLNYTFMGLSIYRLTKEYSGYCMKIRRSSDNATKDIGFSGSFVNRGAIQSFCGSGDGYVHTLYDQSGNGNNAVQTNSSYQPKICESGVFIEKGIKFDGVDDRLDVGDTGGTMWSGYISFETNQEITYNSSRKLSFNLEDNYGGIRFGNTTGYLTNELLAVYAADSNRSGWVSIYDTITTGTVHKLLTIFNTGANLFDMRYDGTYRGITKVNTPAAISCDNVRLGATMDGADWLDGYARSFILLNTTIYVSWNWLSTV